MRYGFIAGMVQFEDHLRPLYDGLPEENQGGFVTGRQPFRVVGNVMRFDRRDDPAHALQNAVGMVCVASISDLKRVSRMSNVVTGQGHRPRFTPHVPTVLFEHGVGYSFHGDPKKRKQASYAGGWGREHLLGLPATNRWVSEPNRLAYPKVPSPIIGCPKLDHMVGVRTNNPRPVVCVAFHWDCKVAPETRWAFPHYQEALVELARVADVEGFDLVAHGHPRERRTWQHWYPKHGIEFIPTFEEVIRRADVYLNDSSSTLYEFASTGRPVVVLNAPWYRRGVNHGLRFWEHADVGLQVDQPSGLLPAILRTLEDDPCAEARAAAIDEIYPYLGRSIPRTIEVLHELEGRIPRRQRGR